MAYALGTWIGHVSSFVPLVISVGCSVVCASSFLVGYSFFVAL
ncbi:11507_t:CDS:2 [Gigaspora rosea]|nr:11507_t:CDS:2 [Gigaspora rosea]